MNDFKNMSEKELISLKADINEELERRERLAYDTALTKFSDALYELYSKFPNKECFTDESTTWEDLRENYDWNF